MKITMTFAVEGLDVIGAEDDATLADYISVRVEDCLRSYYLKPIAVRAECLAPACPYGDYGPVHIGVSYVD